MKFSAPVCRGALAGFVGFCCLLTQIVASDPARQDSPLVEAADAASVFPQGQTVRAVARYQDGRYFGTRDGVWRKMDHHEDDEVDRVWGKPRQSITGLAVWGERIVVAAGNQLFAGPPDDPAQWQELPRGAFAPEPANNWQHLRVLNGRFVVHGSSGFYESEAGSSWARIDVQERRLVGLAEGPDEWWAVASLTGQGGYVLGRSADLRVWTWSEVLPEHFKPTSVIFAVIGEGVAVIAGTYAARGETLHVPQALLSYAWPREGKAKWQLAAHAMPAGASMIDIAAMDGAVWARLPNGDVSASSNGFDWIRVAVNPLGDTGAWFASDHAASEDIIVATNGGRYVQLWAEQLEMAGRGGAPSVAWLDVKSSEPPVVVAQDQPVAPSAPKTVTVAAQTSVAGTAPASAAKQATFPPATVRGAVAMAEAFLAFEHLYVRGEPRSKLAAEAVKVYKVVKEHRPAAAADVAETLAITVINLQPNDIRTTAYLVHHMPEFKRRVQALYGKSYSGVYWNIQKSKGYNTTNEFEVDIVKELLMSYTDNSYLSRVSYPRIPQNYPSYEPDAGRMSVALQGADKAPYEGDPVRENLRKGWAGAALDRDIQHTNALGIQATSALRHLWLVAARTLWPGAAPRDNKELFARSMKEKANAGSIFALDSLALDARKAGRTDEFASYRDLAVQRGIAASRYRSYAEDMAAALAAVADAEKNTVAAMKDYNEQMAASNDALKQLMEKRAELLAAAQKREAQTTDGGVLTAEEVRARSQQRAVLEAIPGAAERTKALAGHEALWAEKIRYRDLAIQLARAADAADSSRTELLKAAKTSFGDLFGKVPEHLPNQLSLAALVGVIDNKVNRARRVEILDAVLKEVPTLADVWAMRADLHLEDGEIDKAAGKLAVAQTINAQDAAVQRVTAKLRSQQVSRIGPDEDEEAAAIADLFMQALAQSSDGKQAATEAKAQVNTPEADYAIGLEYEQGKRGADVEERIEQARIYYVKAAEADYVPAMLGAVRIANASLQHLKLDASQRRAVENEIIRWVGQAANLGNGEALRVRAGWKVNGLAGFERNLGLAMLDLEKAADSGDVPAMRMLAQAAHAGEWGAPEKAEYWLEKAQLAGDPEAGKVLQQVMREKYGDPAAGPETVLREVRMELFRAIKSLHNQKPSFPWGLEQMEQLRPGILGDDVYDERERALLAEFQKPVFHVRLVAAKSPVFNPDDLVLAGSFTSMARQALGDFAPLKGEAQRALWLESGNVGWTKVVAYAQQGSTQRQEIVTLLRRSLGSVWEQSSANNEFRPLRTALDRYRNSAARLNGGDHNVGRTLLHEACVELDRMVKDAVPDFLYSDLKPAAGK